MTKGALFLTKTIFAQKYQNNNTMPEEILSAKYNPQEIEKKIYQIWEESGYFNPDNLPFKKNGQNIHHNYATAQCQWLFAYRTRCFCYLRRHND